MKKSNLSNTKINHTNIKINEKFDIRKVNLNHDGIQLIKKDNELIRDIKINQIDVPLNFQNHNPRIANNILNVKEDRIQKNSECMQTNINISEPYKSLKKLENNVNYYQNENKINEYPIFLIHQTNNLNKNCKNDQNILRNTLYDNKKNTKNQLNKEYSSTKDI